MRAMALIGILFSLFCLVGCSPMTVQSQVSSFHAQEAEKANTFAVRPVSALRDSLEAKTYADLIAQALEARGWTRSGKPEVEVVFAYAIDNGTAFSSVEPIYGRTGGG